MKCPSCCAETTVINTRLRKSNEILRRRKCSKCSSRFTTLEAIYYIEKELPISTKIYDLLSETPEISVSASDIAVELEKDVKYVKQSARRMVKNGIIQRVEVDRHFEYFVSEQQVNHVN